jgi:hypothetical protein
MTPLRDWSVSSVRSSGRAGEEEGSRKSHDGLQGEREAPACLSRRHLDGTSECSGTAGEERGRAAEPLSRDHGQNHRRAGTGARALGPAVGPNRRALGCRATPLQGAATRG